jgi:hypothetical protein
MDGIYKIIMDCQSLPIAEEALLEGKARFEVQVKGLKRNFSDSELRDYETRATVIRKADFGLSRFDLAKKIETELSKQEIELFMVEYQLQSYASAYSRSRIVIGMFR